MTLGLWDLVGLAPLEALRFGDVEGGLKRSALMAGLEERCRKAHVLLPEAKPLSARDVRTVGGLLQEHLATVPRVKKALSFVILPSLLWDRDRGKVANAVSTDRRLELALGGVDDCRSLPFVWGWTAIPLLLRVSLLTARCGAARCGILDLAVGCCLELPFVRLLGAAEPLVLAGDTGGATELSSADVVELVSDRSCARPESGLSGDIFQPLLNSPCCGVPPPVLAIFRGEHLREPDVVLAKSPSEVSLLLSAGAPDPLLELVESSL